MHKRLVLLATLALTSTPAFAARAQDYATAARRLDSLAVVASQAAARLRAYDDSLTRELSQLDTVVVAPMRVLVERRYAPLVREAARQALDSLKPWMGATLERLQGQLLVVTMDRQTETRRGARRDTTLIVAPMVSSVAPPYRVGLTTEAVAGALVRSVPLVVFWDASESFVRWLGRVVPSDSLSAPDWRRIRMDLLSSQTSIGPGCYRGDLSSCKQILDLVPTTDPASRWFDAETRRRFVRNRPLHMQRVDAIATRDCNSGSDLACLVVMRKIPAHELNVGLTLPGRALLARYAAALGGRGAVERMLEGGPERDPMERLAAAARVPADTLLRRWQVGVQTTEAPSRDMSTEVVWVASVWTLGLGLLSLRSSRWR